MTIPAGIEISPNSRFSIHMTPTLAPGTCFICKSSGGDGRYFVDFGYQFDMYGAVYYCSFCFTEAAETVGFVPRGDQVELIHDNEALGAMYESLKKEFETYRESTRVILRSCNCSHDTGPIVASIDDESEGDGPSKSTKQADSKSD